MWNKIFFAVLIVAVVAMSFFTFYAYSWLQSIGNPATALAGYQYYANLGTVFIWISTAVLLALANVVLWISRRAWALWVTFAYFAVFVILRSFWLEKAAYNFQNSDSFFFTPIVGVVLIIVAGAIVFINQFLNLRLHEKMYPPPPETPENIEVMENTE
jgi:hypothetical protein